MEQQREEGCGEIIKRYKNKNFKKYINCTDLSLKAEEKVKRTRKNKKRK